MAVAFGAVRRSWLAGLGGALVFSLITLAYAWGLLSNWEWRLYDLRMAALHDMRPVDELVILARDEKAAASAGGEWTRAHTAEALENLAGCSPRVVGIDFRLAVGSALGGKNNPDQRLALAIKALPAVVVQRYDERFDLEPPFPPFEAAAKSTGLFNVTTEQDGVLRQSWGEVRVREGEPARASLPLAMARLADPKLASPGERFLIRYRAAAGELPILSLGAFLGEGPYPCDRIRDKFVLIGSREPQNHDLYPTPAAHFKRTDTKELAAGLDAPAMVNMYGVEIHAQALLTLLRGDAPRRPLPLRQAILAGLMFIGLLWLHVRYKRKLLLSLLSQLALIAACLGAIWFLGLSLGLYLDLLYPALALGGASLTLILRDATMESRRRKEMEQLFGRFVAPQVAKMMLAREGGIPLGGHRRLVTVMFSDIRGFTPLSEAHPAETVAALLNDYFTAMIEELFAEEGTFDKFIGDALMAFWNDPIEQPDHALRAVRCAVRMQKRLIRLNEEFQRTGRPTLQIGIGLNTGEAVVGNQGSRIQFSYTALGDNVNVAARLMGKAEPGEIVISTTTVAAIAEFEKLFPGAKAGRFELKGKAEPVAAIVITVRED
jgi:adenylate cyclase